VCIWINRHNDLEQLDAPLAGTMTVAKPAPQYGDSSYRFKSKSFFLSESIILNGFQKVPCSPAGSCLHRSLYSRLHLISTCNYDTGNLYTGSNRGQASRICCPGTPNHSRMPG
jgi:hypothetical protein